MEKTPDHRPEKMKSLKFGEWTSGVDSVECFKSCDQNIILFLFFIFIFRLTRCLGGKNGVGVTLDYHFNYSYTPALEFIINLFTLIPFEFEFLRIVRFFLKKNFRALALVSN